MNQQMPAIEFKLDSERSREALVYLAAKLADTASDIGFDVYRACKLLFLADKLHLVRYGRTITGDRYFAMDHGPTPNQIYRKLKFFVDDDPDSPWLSPVLAIDRTPRYPRFIPKLSLAFDNLSLSDIEVLDETLDRHSHKDFKELWALTHEMVAYQNAWGRRGNKGSVPMDFEDFFEDDSDAVAGVREETIDDALLRKAIPDKFAV